MPRTIVEEWKVVNPYEQSLKATAAMTWAHAGSWALNGELPGSHGRIPPQTQTVSGKSCQEVCYTVVSPECNQASKQHVCWNNSWPRSMTTPACVAW